MFFDDRLATVLRQRAESEVAQRTQYRQLLDILGPEKSTAKAGRDPAIVSATWLRMNLLSQEIPAKQRAQIVAEPSWTFLNPELAAHLADCEPDVASAALKRAQLDEEDWGALIPRLPVRARGFLRLRNDLSPKTVALLDRLGVRDRGLPSPVQQQQSSASTNPAIVVDDEDFAPPPPIKIAGLNDNNPDAPPSIEEDAQKSLAHPSKEMVEAKQCKPIAEQEDTSEPSSSDQDADAQPSEERSEISALVERIEQFKRTRENDEGADSHEPRLPLGEESTRTRRKIEAFGFAADAAGRIEWSDGEVAAMVIGTRLIAPRRMGITDNQDPIDRAYHLRQPITCARKQLQGAHAITGDWVVDAQPRFTREGHFCGYVGRFRRAVEPVAEPQDPQQQEADRIRQLLHELRTPVTAVQGYAEVIQQQLFGLASHEYRALAAAIAADAARILAGFEELDQLSRLETGVMEIELGQSDLAHLAKQTCDQLEPVLQPRMAGIALETPAQPCLISLDKDQGEALIWRLLATLGGSCSAGEVLNAQLTSDATQARLKCELPSQLNSEEDVFAAEAKPATTPINAGLFGAGFALRLARAEARAAGGDLERKDSHLLLSLPLLADKQQAIEAKHKWSDKRKAARFPKETAPTPPLSARISPKQACLVIPRLPLWCMRLNQWI